MDEDIDSHYEAKNGVSYFIDSPMFMAGIEYQKEVLKDRDIKKLEDENIKLRCQIKEMQDITNV